MTSTKPKALAVIYTVDDIAHNAIITATAAKEAYAILEAKGYAPLQRKLVNGCGSFGEPKRHYRLGEFGSCYHTVDHCLKLYGGKAIYGWSVAAGPYIARLLPAASNEYATYELTCHVVWQQPDGTLSEVTEIAEGMDKYRCAILGFLPHDRVKHYCQTTIQFLDSFEDTKRLFMPPGAQLRPVRL